MATPIDSGSIHMNIPHIFTCIDIYIYMESVGKSTSINLHRCITYKDKKYIYILS